MLDNLLMVKLLHICGKIMYSEIDVFVFLDRISDVSITANSVAQSGALSRERLQNMT